ncbi:hypothetical protein FIBSPDRAFT_344805 [Athelia psychrophila]|uniref:Uncharacterized protein n=1 Tax=Athelia psychrophila TaxID=1759441 RepID=A0A167W3E9_9AGAM|nr:hypothetical protein FIBSPDRAFT_344805 [Fibularhizoctonia sp. CBS 109695]
MVDTPHADPAASIDSLQSVISPQSALSMIPLEELAALLHRESSPAPRPSLASSSAPALAPIIIVQYIKSQNDRLGSKIAILRSKAQSWDGPVRVRRHSCSMQLGTQRLQNVLRNVCKLFNKKPMLQLEASFSGFEPSVRAQIDMESWKDMVPHLTKLYVSVVVK